MNQERLQQLLESYGANPSNWPEADRHLAGALADDSGSFSQETSRETSQTLSQALSQARETDELVELLQAEEAQASAQTNTRANMKDMQPLVNRIMHQALAAEAAEGAEAAQSPTSQASDPHTESWQEKLINWLFPQTLTQQGASLLRPALVACLPIAVGLFISLSLPEDSAKVIFPDSLSVNNPSTNSLSTGRLSADALPANAPDGSITIEEELQLIAITEDSIREWSL